LCNHGTSLLAIRYRHSNHFRSVQVRGTTSKQLT